MCVLNKSIVATSLLAAFSCVAMADPTVDLSGALQQQLRQESSQGQRSLQNMERAPSNITEGHRVVPVASPSGGPVVHVVSFDVVGISLFSAEEIDSIVGPYRGRDLTFGELRQVANEIMRFYQQHGRMAQAIIPPQDISGGVVKIKVIEARVGKVSATDDKANPSGLREGVALGYLESGNEPGDLLDTAKLDKQLRILAELPGVVLVDNGITGDEKTNISAVVGGGSDFYGRADLSNFGSNSTGAPQASTNMSINNLAGFGDQVTIDGIGSQGSIFGQLKYWMPIGYDGLKVALGGNAMDYRTIPGYSNPVGTGTAYTYGLYSMYPLSKTATANQTVYLNAENKLYDNFSGSIETTKYETHSATLGLSGDLAAGVSYVNYGVGLVVGDLNIQNAAQASLVSTTSKTAGGYSKLIANFGINLPLPIENTNFQFSANGQLADKNLAPSEMIYLGGPYGVRAYPVSQSGGSQGGIATAQINNRITQNLEAHVFFDAGVVQQYVSTWTGWQGNTGASNTYALYGTGLGAKYTQGSFQISGDVAFRVGNNPLLNSSGQQLNVDNHYSAAQAWVKGTWFF